MIRQAAATELRPEGRTYGGLSLEQRRLEQRERVMAAACAVFARHGYASASIEQIVASARVSRTTFYRLFESKEECLLEVFREGIDRLLAALGAVAGSSLDPATKVRVAVERFIETLASDAPLAEVVLIEAVGASPRVEAARTQARRELARVIEEQLATVPQWQGRPREELRLTAIAAMAAMAEPVTDLVARNQLQDWKSLIGPLRRFALRALSPDLPAREER